MPLYQNFRQWTGPSAITQDPGSQSALTITGFQATANSDLLKCFGSDGSPLFRIDSLPGAAPGFAQGGLRVYKQGNYNNAILIVDPATAALQWSDASGAPDASFGRRQTAMVGSADSDIVAATAGKGFR